MQTWGSELIPIAFLFALTLGGLDADFFIVFLQSRQVLQRYILLRDYYAKGLGSFELGLARFDTFPKN